MPACRQRQGGTDHRQVMAGCPSGVSQGLLRNKLDTAGDVIFYDNKAKNTGIAIATARLFNTVSVKKNKPE